MAGLLSVSDALNRILAGAELLAAEDVQLETAARRILACPLTARLTQPPFNASAMDGYAVRATDVAELPATLTIIGEAAAGRGFGGSIAQGQCVRIFTGAPVPSGADAIVIQENTHRYGNTITVNGRPSRSRAYSRARQRLQRRRRAARSTPPPRRARPDAGRCNGP